MKNSIRTYNSTHAYKKLYDSLQELGVNFLKKSVKIDEPEKKQLILQDQSRITYEKYINCAGPGALDIAKSREEGSKVELLES